MTIKGARGGKAEYRKPAIGSPFRHIKARQFAVVPGVFAPERRLIEIDVRQLLPGVASDTARHLRV